MVRSRGKQPLITTRPNDCPFDSLPSEVLHMVCTHLKPTDVGNLRLASSAVASIGLQYLVPEVQLVVAEDSFRKLAAIAAHPVVSKYVTGLFYDADTLKVLDEKEWRENCWSPDYFEKDEFGGLRYKSQSCKGGRVRRHHYSRKQLKEAFREYQRFRDFPERGDQLDRKIFTAMKKLANLKELTIFAQIWPKSKAFEKAFAPGFMTHCSEDVQEWPVGLAPMRSLLLGAYRAGTQIERLRCEYVNWRILACQNNTFKRMIKSLCHLREMCISFSVGNDHEEDEEGLIQVEKCQVYLQESGRLMKFVTSSPHLERLEICFGWNTTTLVTPTELQYVVSDFFWPFLRTVSFEMIGAAEDHLVAFLERHARTIRDLSISWLSLSPGRWWSVFERIRFILKLDSVHLSGDLKSESEFWEFGPDSSDKPQTKLRDGIVSYLLEDNMDRNLSLTDYLDALANDDRDGGCSMDSDSDDDWFEDFFGAWPCLAMPGGLQVRLREPEAFVSGLCHNLYLNVPSSVPLLHVCRHMVRSLGSLSIWHCPLRGGPESAPSNGDGHQRCQLLCQSNRLEFSRVSNRALHWYLATLWDLKGRQVGILSFS